MRLRWKLLLGLAAFLVLVRAAAPAAILEYANRTLADIPGYGGKIEDIDLAVWRGAAQAQGVRVVRTDGRTQVPMFSAREIEGKLSWRALLKGALVLDVTVYRPALTVTDEGPKPPPPPEVVPEVPIQVKLRQLMPVKVDRLVVKDGAVNVRSTATDPPVDLHLVAVELDARNLTNSRKVSDTLVADVDATARLDTGGALKLHLDLNPVASRPTFNVDFRADAVELKGLNDFLRAYGGIDVEKGRLELAAEIAVANGLAEGYVKPAFQDLVIFRWGEKRKGAMAAFREALAAVAAEIFENQPKNRFAGRIPFKGPVGGPDIGLTAAIGSVLRNAFVSAVRPGIEDRIDLGSPGR